jgi:hypothetical protein
VLVVFTGVIGEVEVFAASGGIGTVEVVATVRGEDAPGPAGGTPAFRSFALFTGMIGAGALRSCHHCQAG